MEPDAKVTRDDVVQKVRQSFPAEQFEEVMAVLDGKPGCSDATRARDQDDARARSQLFYLNLASGKIEFLKSQIDAEGKFHQQPRPKVNRANVERIVRRDFPPAEYGNVLATLDEYGHAAHEQDVSRVQLAILKLARGKMDALRMCLKTAKMDFRDVLSSAEYHEYGQVVDTFKTPGEIQKQIIAQDWREYQAWFRATTLARALCDIAVINDLAGEAYHLKLKAFEHYSQAAELGFGPAEYALGVWHYKGIFVKQDFTRALQLYTAAAEKGVAAALNNLGVLYKKGQGVEMNHEKAAEFYQRGAALGDAMSQQNLGFLYENGEGVPQDFAQAAHYFKLAADQGAATAMWRLGMLLTEGKGVPKNHVEGYRWVEKSSARGYEPAKAKLAELSAALRPEELASAGTGPI